MNTPNEDEHAVKKRERGDLLFTRFNDLGFGLIIELPLCRRSSDIDTLATVRAQRERERQRAENEGWPPGKMLGREKDFYGFKGGTLG